MTTVSSSRSFVSPLLRDAENVSPAQALDLTVGYDSEGWPLYLCLRLGDLVVSLNGNLYKVIGFSLDNQVFVQPYGLNHDPSVRWVQFRPEGLRYAPAAICGDTDERV